MEQPTYKMNRGAILAQGWRWLARRLQPDELAGGLCSFIEQKYRSPPTATARCRSWCRSSTVSDVSVEGTLNKRVVEIYSGVVKAQGADDKHRDALHAGEREGEPGSPSQRSGDIFSRGVEAHGVQAGVVTVLRQKFGMGAALHNTALIHDQNQVSFLDGRQTVSDD